MSHYDVWGPYWDAMIKEVLRLTGDQDAVNAMLTMATDVTLMLAAPLHASVRELDLLWLKAAHRILYRIDLACHHADLSVLANCDSKEEKQAELRVASVVQTSARAARMADFGPSFTYRSAKRPKFDKPRREPSTWCPHHKRMVNHTPESCRLAIHDKSSAPQHGK